MAAHPETVPDRPSGPHPDGSARPGPEASPQPRGGVPWGSILRNLALVLTVLAMLWLALNVRLPSLDELQARIAGLGVWGPLAFIGLYAVVAVTPIPVTIMAVAAGAIFGLPAGTVLSMIGVVVGCYGGYGIARLLGRKTVMRLLGSHAEVVEERLEDGGFYAVCTLRLMPGIPYWPVNYGSGALGITRGEFLLATALSALPGQVSLIAVGAFLGEPTLWSGLAVVISWVVVIVLTVLSYRRWRRTTRGAEQRSDATEQRGGGGSADAADSA